MLFANFGALFNQIANDSQTIKSIMAPILIDLKYQKALREIFKSRCWVLEDLSERLCSSVFLQEKIYRPRVQPYDYFDYFKENSIESYSGI